MHPGYPIIPTSTLEALRYERERDAILARNIARARGDALPPKRRRAALRRGLGRAVIRLGERIQGFPACVPTPLTGRHHAHAHAGTH